MLRLIVFLAALALGLPAEADQVTITGGTVYVTREDCAQLTRHQPAPDVAYKPGADVHGKYVPPADLPGSTYPNLLPDKLQFDVQANPLAYGGSRLRQEAGPGGKFANTTLPVAHVEVDLKSGGATVNGRPLSVAQEGALREACRKAGVR